MRWLSHPSAGAGTGGGSVCVLVAAGVSPRAWTAGGAAGTLCRPSGVLCQLPPAPAPSRLPASSPVKCGISVKSKHSPSLGEGCKNAREGSPNPTGPTIIPTYLLPCLSCLFFTIKTPPKIPMELPRARWPW